jgi:hypothetical protein
VLSTGVVPVTALATTVRGGGPEGLVLSGRLLLIRDGYFDLLLRIHRQRAQPEIPESSALVGIFRPITKPARRITCGDARSVLKMGVAAAC